MKEAPQLIEDLQWLTAPLAGEQGAIPWLWVVVLAGALGILVLLLWSRWRKGKKVLPFLAAPLPHVQALAALRDLEKRLEEGREKEFVAEVSGIVRIYIQARFGLRAPHRSTEEFLYEASQSKSLSAPHHDLLGGFLMHCDLVKFAKRGVVLDEMRALLGSARQFVEGTVPQAPAVGGKK